MKQKNKKELSYFRLKLRSYMSEHHPEKLQDTEFILSLIHILKEPLQKGQTTPKDARQQQQQDKPQKKTGKGMKV